MLFFLIKQEPPILINLSFFLYQLKRNLKKKIFKIFNLCFVCVCMFFLNKSKKIINKPHKLDIIMYIYIKCKFQKITYINYLRKH